MALTIEPVGFGPPAFLALQRAIATAQGGNRLAPVTVVVPTNAAGVTLRRYLGRRGGIAGVSFLTIYRLGDLLAGGSLAAAGRRPVTSPVVGAAMAVATARATGPLRSAKPHRATVEALVRIHRELRELDSGAVSRIGHTGSPVARNVVTIHGAAQELLNERWHDEADLLFAAIERCTPAAVAGFGTIVVALPQRLSAPAINLLDALGEHLPVHVLIGRAGDDIADAGPNDIITRLGSHRVVAPSPGGAPTAQLRPHIDVVSVTDADDEVRVVLRRLVDAARDGMPFDRMALLWTTADPYLRLIGEQFDAAGIPWNGTSPGRLAERIAARSVLRVMDLDRLNWRRVDVFELLAGASVLDTERRPIPTAAWERVAREAGVRSGADWDETLERYAQRTLRPVDDEDDAAGLRVSRRGSQALALRAFVLELREHLGDPTELRTWEHWVEWSHTLLRRLLGGETARQRLPLDEQRGFDALEAAIDRLRGVDEFLGPVNRQGFRDALTVELDSRATRRGRIGHGVLIGPLSSGLALDSDLVVILGAVDGSFPSRPQPDPLLGEADRRRAGIPPTPSEVGIGDQRRALLAAVAGAPALIIGVARGDLRRSAVRSASRWIDDLQPRADIHQVHVASHVEALTTSEFPLHPQEFAGRALWRHVRAGHQIDDHPLALGDHAIVAGLGLIRARELPYLTAFDGDLSGMAVPSPFGSTTPIAPTRIERWASCPQSYLMRHLLRVDAEESSVDELVITALDRGSLIHEALDDFLTAMLSLRAGPWPSQQSWSPEHRARAHRALDEAADRAAKAGTIGHPTIWHHDLARLHIDLGLWLDDDDTVRAEETRQLTGSETTFGAPDSAWPAAPVTVAGGRQILFRGAIDRVDRRADGSLVVIDHKTGTGSRYTKVSDTNPVGSGQLYQLGAYVAAAASAHGAVVTGIRAEYAFVERRASKRRVGFTVTDEVWATFTDALTVIADCIEGGLFPPRPEPPVFKPFVSCRYCDPDGMGTADRYREWLRKRRDPRLTAYLTLIGEIGETDGRHDGDEGDDE